MCVAVEDGSSNNTEICTFACKQLSPKPNSLLAINDILVTCGSCAASKVVSWVSGRIWPAAEIFNPAEQSAACC